MSGERARAAACSAATSSSRVTLPVAALIDLLRLSSARWSSLRPAAALNAQVTPASGTSESSTK